MSTATTKEGKVHRVRENDCLFSIAAENGLFWQTVWGHDNNRKLRELRGDPNLLLKGDEVFVPERQTTQESGATEECHRFRRKGVPVLFRLRLVDEGEVQANTPYMLMVEGQTFHGSSDGEGMIEVAVHPGAKTGYLRISDGDEAEIYEVALGGADPVDDVNGVRKRLTNLGYDCGEEENDEALAAAISSFQLDEELEMTGEVDDATRDKLCEAHGC